MRRYGSREGRRWSLVMELVSLLDLMVDLGKMPGRDPTGNSPSSELLAQTGHGGDQTGYMTVPKREMQSLSGKGLHLQAPSLPSNHLHPIARSSHSPPASYRPSLQLKHLNFIAYPSHHHFHPSHHNQPQPTAHHSNSNTSMPLPILPRQPPPSHCPSLPPNHLCPVVHPSHPTSQPPEPHLVLPTGPSPRGVTHAGATLSPLPVPPPTFYSVQERSTREPRCQMGPTVAKLDSYIINHCPKLCQLCICDG